MKEDKTEEIKHLHKQLETLMESMEALIHTMKDLNKRLDELERVRFKYD